eukprot:331403-Pelagomonas_calceolata.AAC.4
MDIAAAARSHDCFKYQMLRCSDDELQCLLMACFRSWTSQPQLQGLQDAFGKSSLRQHQRYGDMGGKCH